MITQTKKKTIKQKKYKSLKKFWIPANIFSTIYQTVWFKIHKETKLKRGWQKSLQKVKRILADPPYKLETKKKKKQD